MSSSYALLVDQEVGNALQAPRGFWVLVKDKANSKDNLFMKVM
jgi:hypothetical protein